MPIKTVDVAALAAGENLESTARRIRYEFFAEVADEVGAAWIATGHTADDQAETVLHSDHSRDGIQGLRGVLANPDRMGGGGSSTPRTSPPSLTVGVRPCSALSSLSPAPRCSTLRHPQADLPRGRHQRRSALHAQSHPARILAATEELQPGWSRLRHLAAHANDAHEVIEAVAAEALMKAERPRAGDTFILDAALGSSKADPRGPAPALGSRRLAGERDGIRGLGPGGGGVVRRAQRVRFPRRHRERHAGRVVQIGPRH